MANADFVWLSSVWPETYAYTLSVAFIARVYPVAFDMDEPISVCLRCLVDELAEQPFVARCFLIEPLCPALEMMRKPAGRDGRQGADPGARQR